MTALPKRLYEISSNPPIYFAGKYSNGTQLLVGCQQPEIVAVEFNASGNFLNIKVQDLAAISNDQNYKYDIGFMISKLYSTQFVSNFSIENIFVERFFLTDRWIGISDLPEFYEDFLANPNNYNQERRQQLNTGIIQWLEQESFVFYWDEEYYLNRFGEVESS